MSDIYHALVVHDFSKERDATLQDTRDAYGDACMSINNAMQLIGYLLQIVDDEGYSGDDAKRYLFLIGNVLSQLPRISEALSQNERSADYELKKRKKGGGAK